MTFAIYSSLIFSDTIPLRGSYYENIMMRGSHAQQPQSWRLFLLSRQSAHICSSINSATAHQNPHTHTPRCTLPTAHCPLTTKQQDRDSERPGHRRQRYTEKLLRILSQLLKIQRYYMWQRDQVCLDVTFYFIKAREHTGNAIFGQTAQWKQFMCVSSSSQCVL